MSKEFFATATIQFNCDGDSYKENIVLTEVENFVDAVARIEAYYGNDLETIIELNLFVILSVVICISLTSFDTVSILLYNLSHLSLYLINSSFSNLSSLCITLAYLSLSRFLIII